MADDTNTSLKRSFTPPRILGFAVSLGLLSLLAFGLQPSADTAQAITAQTLTRSYLKTLRAVADSTGATPKKPVSWTVSVDGPPKVRDAAHRELAKLTHVRFTPAAPSSSVPHTALQFSSPSSDSDVLVLVAQHTHTAPLPKGIKTQLKTQRRVGSWLSILPPLLAVLCAIFFRQLIAGLIASVWVGAAIATSWNPIEATVRTAKTYLWGNLTESFNLYVLAFTLSLVGVVMVITRIGGNAGLIQAISRFARNARSTRIATAAMGLFLFFDDYANTVVVGSTARPLTDRWRISREKLAYLVDSTSAPIAGIAIISTWVGYEVGLFQDLSVQLGLGLSGYDIFFEVLPLRFYCLFTIVFVFATCFTSRDFGPMLRAERRARRLGQLHHPDSNPVQPGSLGYVEPWPYAPPRWEVAAFPILLVLFCVLLGMYWSGWRGADGASIPSLEALFSGRARWGSFFGQAFVSLSDIVSWQAWREAFSNADNARVLFWGTVPSTLLVFVLARVQGVPLGEAFVAWTKALPAMGSALAIFVLAWCMRSVCDDLGTHIYLIGATRDLLTPHIVPLVTFLLAAAVAFATGTSWGTMGILIPSIIPTALQIASQTGDPAETMLILMLCFGAILDGAIFGDHCSPISDTTVMSSMSSACNHLDHVKTQIPYALTTMTAAASFGYIGVAFGLPTWLALGMGSIFLIVFLIWVGQRHGARYDLHIAAQERLKRSLSS